MISKKFNTVSGFILILWLCLQANAALAAEQLYENAFRLIVEGAYGEAYEQLGEIVTMYPGTTYARFAEARRQQLEELNLPDIRRKKIDQSGRIESVIFGTLYSTWLGVGSARLANADSAKAVAAGMMIGAPAGLLTSLIVTRNARLSDGQAALINSGGYWGTWQGYGLAILLDKNDDEKTMISSAMAGGLLGIFTTSALTRKMDISFGDAGMISYGGLWGTWLALSGGVVADVDGDDNLLALALIGGNVGAAAMAAASSKLEFSFAQASLINLGGIVGTIVAGGTLLILQPDSGRTAMATLMAGGVLGLASGYQIFGHSNVAGISQGSALGMPYFVERGCQPVSRYWAMNNQQYGANSREVRANLFSVRF